MFEKWILSIVAVLLAAGVLASIGIKFEVAQIATDIKWMKEGMVDIKQGVIENDHRLDLLERMEKEGH